MELSGDSVAKVFQLKTPSHIVLNSSNQSFEAKGRHTLLQNVSVAFLSQVAFN